MKGADRRTRGPGMVVLALLFGTTAAALALTLRYHLGVPGLVVTFLLGLPSLYLGWVALQDARRPQSLAQVADGLAARLRSQWAEEAEARRLNDPYPLPVTWTAADAPLAGDLDALKRLATSGFGWSARRRGNWAKGPEDLAGGGDRKLADVLATVPTGRLVVLGEPGSGKTMLMVGLVLDLLVRRRRGGPVPVLASVASWDPVSQDLHGWLGETLITGYPDLAGAPPPRSAGDNRFKALVEAGLIVPVLDGLDELPDSARPRAITRINKELKPDEQLVVTCRTEQYRAAVSPQNGPGAVLRAAAVQLSPLEIGEVASYLRKTAGPDAEDRWDYLKTLSAESPVRQALATPLMAGLARPIYNPDPDDPDEQARDLRHPAELCDYADRSAVEAHLFDEFVPAAYRAPAGGRWTARKAEMWLVFLARHLEQTAGSPDLAWWQLQETTPHAAFGLTVGFGLASGLAGWLASWLAFGPPGNLWFGLAGGFAGWLAAGSRSAAAPARGMRISTSSLAAGMAAGLGLGLAAAFAGGLTGGLTVKLVDGLAGGLGLGLGLGLAFGLTGVPGEPAGVTSPSAVLSRDRRMALLLMLAGGPMGGLAAALAFGLAGGLTGKFGLGLKFGMAAGFGPGLGLGLGLSMRHTAWPAYMLTKGWLALHHRLPWSLMNFLADAHRRGVLRHAGAVYQFRHLELQRRLAIAYRTKVHQPPPPSPAATASPSSPPSP